VGDEPRPELSGNAYLVAHTHPVSCRRQRCAVNHALQNVPGSVRADGGFEDTIRWREAGAMGVVDPYTLQWRGKSTRLYMTDRRVFNGEAIERPLELRISRPLDTCSSVGAGLGSVALAVTALRIAQATRQRGCRGPRGHRGRGSHCHVAWSSAWHQAPRPKTSGKV